MLLDLSNHFVFYIFSIGFVFVIFFPFKVNIGQMQYRDLTHSSTPRFILRLADIYFI